MEPVRKVIHIDMDAFYASIEQRDHPELRGKPVIVGGDPTRRGVVATCSYEARRYGIHSAMAARTAVQLCPHGIFVRPRFDAYRAVSAQIMDIFRRYTDLVEPLSLDEAYLDVTVNARQIPSATQVAQEIKALIKAETGLTASAGVSYNKFIAKLASDYHKPDGLTVIPPVRAARFLESLPVEKFFGVGRVTAARLKTLGVETGMDLKRLSEEQLRGLFHERGSILYRYVRGDDERPVMPTRVRKSVGKETTLAEDTADMDLLFSLLKGLAEQVEERLKAGNISGKTVILKLRWSNFQLFTRRVSLTVPIQSSAQMVALLQPLLAQYIEREQRQVRLIGVTVANLQHPQQQTSERPEFITQSLWDSVDDPAFSV
jgi:DNA polymerase-4